MKKIYLQVKPLYSFNAELLLEQVSKPCVGGEAINNHIRACSFCTRHRKRALHQHRKMLLCSAWGFSRLAGNYFFCSYAAGVAVCVCCPMLRNCTWQLTVVWWISNTTNQICHSLTKSNIHKYRNIFLPTAYRRLWLLLSKALVRIVILLLLRLLCLPQVSTSCRMFILSDQLYRAQLSDQSGLRPALVLGLFPTIWVVCWDIVRAFWSNIPDLSQLQGMEKNICSKQSGHWTKGNL